MILGPSRPFRYVHDVWRRVCCNWLAGETLTGLLSEEEALDLAHELVYGLVKRAYHL